MSVVGDMQGLSDLSQCAYALGMAFGREAQAAADDDRKFRYYELFDRCFHGFRVAVALRLRLARAGLAPLRADDRVHAGEPAEADRPDAPDRIEYDRDRDSEAASLPILLKTLKGVVADAEGLPGPPPAELPTLRELLARMVPAAATGDAEPQATARPASPAPSRTSGGLALLARPPTTTSPTPLGAAPSSARSRLLGSVTTGLPRLGKAATGPPG